jgi:hypothetical protein
MDSLERGEGYVVEKGVTEGWVPLLSPLSGCGCRSSSMVLLVEVEEDSAKPSIIWLTD